MPSVPSAPSVPIAVLISGSGSNLHRLLEDRRTSAYDVAVVIADREAKGLRWADEHGVPTVLIPWNDYPNRRSFTAAVCDVIDEYGCEWVVLAGFMRVLAPIAISRFPGRIVNIHPSLLPAFPGAHAVETALAAGVETTGVTVHFVVEDVDAGPIIAQRTVPVLPGDDVASLHARIQVQEHELYPAVVDALAAGHITVSNNEVAWS
ncbi:MAG TPA: phosphoribosylglycinamide formyltransferase [Actinobacteria bacterium]|nr:phosphoribosylglycinamide formyltransferase [Actinomycetota bacterium]HDL48625.1 phosphoribosylglycinamide formyltransferase [Actinomycetota bacterium]